MRRQTYGKTIKSAAFAVVASLFSFGAAQGQQTPASQPPGAPAAASRAAVDETPAGQFITSFPENDTYRLQIYGDGFGEGLLAALIEQMGAEPRLQIQKKHKPIGALIRPEWEDDIKPEDTSREIMHIAVIMTGLSDRQIIRTAPNTRPLAIGSDPWREEYGRRFDRLVKALRKRNVGVFVVGQPVMRREDINRQSEMLSEIMRQRAQANGAKFIDIVETFEDDGGGFSQWGPDVSGNRVKLRDGDGITFAPAGHKKLAHFVAREIRREIQAAAVDRTTPLAGDDAEQKRINPSKAAPASATRTPAIPAFKTAVTAQTGAAPADPGAEQKADHGRVALRVLSATGREETVNIDIVRPAISATVLSLVNRREASQKTVQPGETLVDGIGGGLTVVSTVSSLGDAGNQGGPQRKRATTGANLVDLVMIKGERLPPRLGRADDFAWPRRDTDVEPATAVPPRPAAAPASASAPGRPTAPQTPPGRTPPRG